MLSPRALRGSSLLIPIDFDDSFGEGFRSFLRQIVPDAAGDGPVHIFAREILHTSMATRISAFVCGDPEDFDLAKYRHSAHGLPSPDTNIDAPSSEICFVVSTSICESCQNY